MLVENANYWGYNSIAFLQDPLARDNALDSFRTTIDGHDAASRSSSTSSTTTPKVHMGPRCRSRIDNASYYWLKPENPLLRRLYRLRRLSEPIA